ncbi:hypothetical protein U1Q18_046803, partial [Sarracenia purpurea var. burkii]
MDTKKEPECIENDKAKYKRRKKQFLNPTGKLNLPKFPKELPLCMVKQLLTPWFLKKDPVILEESLHSFTKWKCVAAILKRQFYWMSSQFLVNPKFFAIFLKTIRFIRSSIPEVSVVSLWAPIIQPFSVMEGKYLSSLASSSSLFNSHSQMSIGPHSWLEAEQSAQGILSTIQPTMASEHKRNEVIIYLQNLIREYFGIEVLPFGSVPLKTYLPDGDIDLTVVCPRDTEEILAIDICSFLEREEQDNEFVIKNVEYVRAQFP